MRAGRAWPTGIGQLQSPRATEACQKNTVGVGTLKFKTRKNCIAPGFVSSKTKDQKTLFKIMVSLGMGGGELAERSMGAGENLVIGTF